MKKNMGDMDRTVRMILGTIAILAIIFLLIQPTPISNIFVIILLVFAAIMFVTAVMGVCLLYVPFGFSTRREEEATTAEVNTAASAPPAAKFELYKDRAGEFRWRLLASNGQIIATGGEGYQSKTSAWNGINSVKKNVTDAAIIEK